MVDGTKLVQCQCGKNHNLTRIFVNIDWAINDWGGSKEMVEALKKRKQMTLDDLPRLKAKYMSEPVA